MESICSNAFAHRFIKLGGRPRFSQDSILDRPTSAAGRLFRAFSSEGSGLIQFFEKASSREKSSVDFLHHLSSLQVAESILFIFNRIVVKERFAGDDGSPQSGGEAFQKARVQCCAGNEKLATKTALLAGNGVIFVHAAEASEEALLGLIRKEDGTAVEVLKKVGLDLREIRFEVERRISHHIDYC